MPGQGVTEKMDYLSNGEKCKSRDVFDGSALRDNLRDGESKLHQMTVTQHTATIYLRTGAADDKHTQADNAHEIPLVRGLHELYVPSPKNEHCITGNWIVGSNGYERFACLPYLPQVYGTFVRDTIFFLFSFEKLGAPVQLKATCEETLVRGFSALSSWKVRRSQCTPQETNRNVLQIRTSNKCAPNTTLSWYYSDPRSPTRPATINFVRWSLIHEHHVPRKVRKYYKMWCDVPWVLTSTAHSLLCQLAGFSLLSCVQNFTRVCVCVSVSLGNPLELSTIFLFPSYSESIFDRASAVRRSVKYFTCQKKFAWKICMFFVKLAVMCKRSDVYIEAVFILKLFWHFVLWYFYDLFPATRPTPDKRWTSSRGIILRKSRFLLFTRKNNL